MSRATIDTERERFGTFALFGTASETTVLPGPETRGRITIEGERFGFYERATGRRAEIRLRSGPSEPSRLTARPFLGPTDGGEYTRVSSVPLRVTDGDGDRTFLYCRRCPPRHPPFPK